MTFKFKAGDKLEVVTAIADLRVGDIVTCTDQRFHSDGEDAMTDVVRDRDGKRTAGCFAKRFKLVPVLDLTKPLETQEGVPFTLVTAEGRGEQPIMGYIGTQETLRSFSKDGTYYGNGSTCVYDLRNVVPKPKTAEVFANVYMRNGLLSMQTGYDTLQSAKDNAALHCVGRVKVVLVEGQFAE